ncbi:MULTISPECIES: LysR family transcriptional regulator [Paraburkholderia]|uniref:LysR family transcriptional regulator n=1 Tax=Paraburkholderia TaxID=1822464 RepID=UPI00225713DA|nr:MULTISPECIES: LysR family transcriptional regulator [Paraburkholderia]MCX4163889.1 LysR family transcriptional regulator [Paraburkholderia megapolitana]MDN7159384.1 LysR family transcriptional regulator [Paraburkholderia sp. CHISQ3]MDQ6496431.1 LysR family transcriptional regulator [Paraburkholderia megapolitana]
MNSDEADQTEAFLAVVESGSFSAAGRKLGRDGSVISRRIAALEARLGIRLLERSTRRVAPTEAGIRFRARVHEAMDMMRAAEDEARAMAASPTGLLRVSLPLAFGRRWISPRLPEFLARYPALRVEATYTDRYVDLIAEGFDAAVRLGEMKDSRLIGRRIAATRRLICAAPSYLDQRPALNEAEDLLRHDCICFTRLTTHPVWHLQRNGKNRAVRISGRLETDDVEAVVHAALAGMGVIMATDWLVARELADGRLVPVLTDWTVGGEAAVSVVRASVQHEPAKSRAFVDWMVEIFAAVPWQEAVR